MPHEPRKIVTEDRGSVISGRTGYLIPNATFNVQQRLPGGPHWITVATGILLPLPKALSKGALSCTPGQHSRWLKPKPNPTRAQVGPEMFPDPVPVPPDPSPGFQTRSDDLNKTSQIRGRRSQKRNITERWHANAQAEFYRICEDDAAHHNTAHNVGRDAFTPFPNSRCKTQGARGNAARLLLPAIASALRQCEKIFQGMCNFT
ncbi:hypothetical protein B0H11DRAFT_1918402 [Mycena galericulata]|nr:hypothetical protein B0H11DRAFT_1918402 [Mycena galericulata]